MGEPVDSMFYSVPLPNLELAPYALDSKRSILHYILQIQSHLKVDADFQSKLMIEGNEVLTQDLAQDNLNTSQPMAHSIEASEVMLRLLQFHCAKHQYTHHLIPKTLL